MANNFGVFCFKIILIEMMVNFAHVQCLPPDFRYRNKQLLNMQLKPKTQQLSKPQTMDEFPQRILNDVAYDLRVRQLMEDLVLSKQPQTLPIEQPIEGIPSSAQSLPKSTEANNFDLELKENQSESIQYITTSQQNGTQATTENSIKTENSQNQAQILKPLKEVEVHSQLESSEKLQPILFNYRTKLDNYSEQRFQYDLRKDLQQKPILKSAFSPDNKHAKWKLKQTGSISTSDNVASSFKESENSHPKLANTNFESSNDSKTITETSKHIIEPRIPEINSVTKTNYVVTVAKSPMHTTVAPPDGTHKQLHFNGNHLQHTTESGSIENFTGGNFSELKSHEVLPAANEAAHRDLRLNANYSSHRTDDDDSTSKSMFATSTKNLAQKLALDFNKEQFQDDKKTSIKESDTKGSEATEAPEIISDDFMHTNNYNEPYENYVIRTVTGQPELIEKISSYKTNEFSSSKDFINDSMRIPIEGTEPIHQLSFAGQMLDKQLLQNESKTNITTYPSNLRFVKDFIDGSNISSTNPNSQYDDALSYFNTSDNQNEFSTSTTNDSKQINFTKKVDFVKPVVGKDNTDNRVQQPVVTLSLFNATSEIHISSQFSHVNDSYFQFSDAIQMTEKPTQSFLKAKTDASSPNYIFPETQVTELVEGQQHKFQPTIGEKVSMAGNTNTLPTATFQPQKTNRLECKTPVLTKKERSDTQNSSFQSNESNETMSTSVLEDNIESVTQVVWSTQSISYKRPTNSLHPPATESGRMTLLKPETKADHLNELIAIIGSSLQDLLRQTGHLQQGDQQNKSTSVNNSMRRMKLQEEVTSTVNCHTAAMSSAITSASSSAASLAMTAHYDDGSETKTKTEANANTNNTSAAIEKSIESYRQNIEKWPTFKNNQLNNDSLTKSGNLDTKENVNADNNAEADAAAAVAAATAATAVDVNVNSYGNADDKEKNDKGKGKLFFSNKKNMRLEIKVDDKDTANKEIDNNMDNDRVAGYRNNETGSKLREQKEHNEQAGIEFKISHAEGGTNEMSAIENKLPGISKHKSHVTAETTEPSHDDILETYITKSTKTDDNQKVGNQVINENVDNNNVDLKIEINPCNEDKVIDNSNTAAPAPVPANIEKLKGMDNKMENMFDNLLTTTPDADANDTNTNTNTDTETDKNVTVSAPTKEEIAATNWWNSLPYAEIRKFLNSIFDSVTASADDDIISNESIDSMLAAEPKTTSHTVTGPAMRTQDDKVVTIKDRKPKKEQRQTWLLNNIWASLLHY